MNRFTNPPSENPPSQQEMSFSGVSELSSNVQDNAQESEVQEHKPIPIPSHARQYRAIGLIKAKYERSEEQLTKGTLITSTDKNIDAVVLGRLISLFKKRIDLEKLEEYVEGNKDMTLKKAAQEFGVSIFTISYWLKRLGYSYKKKIFPTWKQVKKSELNTKDRSKI
jgi:hypothetical protein